jgi:hypothetical protein
MAVSDEGQEHRSNKQGATSKEQGQVFRASCDSEPKTEHGLETFPLSLRPASVQDRLETAA